ncbi:MAG: Dabb family protein [Chloroflexi bacterium]|nr:MAG: Dabb family protein [Chloroflexota bacterium]
MFTHVVLFKLKDSGDLETAVSTLLTLKNNVPTLKLIEVGTDVIHSERSYDIALITRFDDLDGYKVYAKHPNHLPVLDYMRSVVETAVAVDFES